MRLVQEATLEDLDAVVALTASTRRRLAAWAPVWWRPARDADELHRLWLSHLIRADGPVVRVAREGGHVTGCAVSMPQPGQWFIDDVALVDDAAWAEAGIDLLEAIAERPALTCVPTAHLARRASSDAAGLQHVSSYWIRPTTAGRAAATRPLEPGAGIPPPPPHTFGGELDPFADGALVHADGGGSVVVGSPSITAPPVYDPGGTVCVVDRVVGDPAPLLERALAAAGARGDVLLAVVADVDDHWLRSGLKQLGFERTVDVFAWPAAGRGPRARRTR